MKNAEMQKEREVLYIVQQERYTKKSKHFFENYFKAKYDILTNIDLKFPPNDCDDNYDQQDYLQDLETIKKRWDKKALLIDDVGFSPAPVRILCPNSFFNDKLKRRADIILHEFSHYKTNPFLHNLRMYIRIYFPAFFSLDKTPNNSYAELIENFNRGLVNIFELPKLIEEINTEIEASRDDMDACARRLKYFYNNTRLFLKTNHISNTLDYNFLLNWHYALLWRWVTLKQFDFTFSKRYLKLIEDSYDLLIKMAIQSGFGGLNILKEKNTMLEAIWKYDVAKLRDLCAIFFNEYCEHYSTLFPSALQPSFQQYLIDYNNHTERNSHLLPLLLNTPKK